jgi:hypothetical protein
MFWKNLGQMLISMEIPRNLGKIVENVGNIDDWLTWT